MAISSAVGGAPNEPMPPIAPIIAMGMPNIPPIPPMAPIAPGLNGMLIGLSFRTPAPGGKAGLGDHAFSDCTKSLFSIPPPPFSTPAPAVQQVEDSAHQAAQAQD
eukprot:CAMPEP_0169120828 /NCGR_PEP_ID=MMETSP1015-20121227/32323_1 /TAXON_ID=342587 /ORGANISM="Karlodinium micrum, Strain CCMP2283" /LENGTH=104 /DNA_ID=CAMNT_0009183851 /DNA_START=220 /DNA_END=535 /DNA_ORIENTATION=+